MLGHSTSCCRTGFMCEGGRVGGECKKQEKEKKEKQITCTQIYEKNRIPLIFFFFFLNYCTIMATTRRARHDLAESMTRYLITVTHSG